MYNVEFFEKFLELKNDNTPFVAVTMTNARGSAPQDVGSRMLVGESGLLFGTVGGGKIEAHCIEYAKSLLNTQEKIKSETWNLQTDIGMTCGGEASFLFENEASQSHWNIAIFGAGHVSQALTRLLLTMSCKLTVIDNRKEWLDKLPENNNLIKIHNIEMANEVDNLPQNTFIISMTMGHASDVPVLNQCLRQKFPYTGVIGSKSKRNAIEKDLEELGLCSEQISKLICPIGEPIGKNEPAEIAVSIAAQLLKLRDEYEKAHPKI